MGRGETSKAAGCSPPKLFTDYITWVHNLLGRLGIPAEALADNLRNINRVIGDDLGPPAAEAVSPYLASAPALLGRKAAQPAPFLGPAAPRDDGQRRSRV